MIRHFPSGHAQRLMVLLAGIGSVLAAAISVAPVAGAGVSPAARAWRIEPSPVPTGAFASQLGAVSCSGPGSCVAVGSGSYPSGHQLAHQLALIERLSDGTWTIAANPAVRGATASPLDGVSCPAADFCVAVGYARFAHPQAAFDALAETWNGTSWTRALVPMPAGASEPSLAAVSCPAAGVCVAVGNYIDSKTGQYRPLAERLAGHTWSVVPAPDPHGASGNSEFTGIDCAAPASCEAVGNVSYNDTLQSVFAYGLSGSTWTRQRQVNPGPDPGNTDGAVSCSAASACTSVGSVFVVSQAALAEHWNGSTWVRQATPAPVNRPENALYDVSCATGTSCVAVGVSARTVTSAKQAMAEVWNGTSWSQSPLAGITGMTIGLSAVSCTSATACIAAGDSATTSSESTLIEAYTG